MDAQPVTYSLTLENLRALDMKVKSCEQFVTCNKWEQCEA